jgi:hypothetical protein
MVGTTQEDYKTNERMKGELGVTIRGRDLKIDYIEDL